MMADFIAKLVDANELVFLGASVSVTHVKRKFNWKKFRFDPEHWIAFQQFCYEDSVVRFPVFDDKETKFFSEHELNEFLLLEKLKYE